MLQWTLGAVAVLTAVTMTTVRCDDENLDFHRPESWAMAFAATATIPTSLDAIVPVPDWQGRAGLEFADIPRLSAGQRQVGFDGTKEEDVNRSSVLARMRAGLALPSDARLEIGWIPPIRIRGIAVDLASAALEVPVLQRGPWSFACRAYGETGSIGGDITCSAADASQPAGSAANPLGCTGPSHDTLSMSLAGLEAQAALAWWEGGPSSYIGVAGNAMWLRFQVRADTATGEDRTVLRTHGLTESFTLGIAAPWSTGLRFAIECFYSPLAVDRPRAGGMFGDGFFNVRLMARALFP